MSYGICQDPDNRPPLVTIPLRNLAIVASNAMAGAFRRATCMEQRAEKAAGDLESLSAGIASLRDKLIRGDIGDLNVPKYGDPQSEEPQDPMRDFSPSPR